MSANPLGDVISKRLLKGMELTQEQLGDELGVSRVTINGLVTGKRPISEVMALRLGRFTGDSPAYWLELGSAGSDTKKKTALPQPATPAQKTIRRWKATGQHTLVDWEITEAINRGILDIKPVLENSIQPASYDLSIGNAIVSSEDGSVSTDLREEPLKMPPDSTAVVQTLEFLRFPPILLGRLGSMTKLATKGIMTIHGHHVDPGFQGTLFVTLKNIGRNHFYLVYGKKFLSIEISFLPVEPRKSYRGDNQERKTFLEVEKETVGGAPMRSEAPFRADIDEINDIAK
ncbi:MAG: HigA family addiction module antidote protein [Desulfobacterales bacterium]|nr:HigA family addiction module antidote protein [Desulfobacterales bacterium]